MPANEPGDLVKGRLTASISSSFSICDIAKLLDVLCVTLFLSSKVAISKLLTLNGDANEITANDATAIVAVFDFEKIRDCI